MSYTLNMPIIKVLIQKDWYLQRKIIAMYTIGSLFALSFISLGQWQFFIGTSLLISMIIGLSNHQLMNTIVRERKEQTLPFIMSLPITPIDYVVSKLIANMSLYLVPWVIVLIVTLAVFWFTPVPNGFIPSAVIVGIYFLLCYCITWGIGMMSESEGVLLFVMIFLNCLVGPIMYFGGRQEEITRHIFTDTLDWNSYSISLIVMQFIIILLALLLAVYWQARKKTFL